MTEKEKLGPEDQDKKTDNSIEKPQTGEESSKYQQIRKNYDRSASMEVNYQFISLLLIIISLFTEGSLFIDIVLHYRPFFPPDILMQQIGSLILLGIITVLAIYQFRILLNWKTQSKKQGAAMTKGYLTLFDKISRITISGLLIILCNIGLIPLLLMFHTAPPIGRVEDFQVARFVPVVAICFIYPVFEVFLLVHWIRKMHHIGQIQTKFDEDHLFDNLEETDQEKEPIKKE
jgi:hypothetical protein